MHFFNLFVFSRVYKRLGMHSASPCGPALGGAHSSVAAGQLS